MIGISPSACQLKQQFVDVGRKIVVALEDERQIKTKGYKDFPEENMA